METSVVRHRSREADEHVGSGSPALRSAPPSDVARPRWMVLYLSVVSTALLGLLASTAVPMGTWGRLVDLATGIAIFAVMWLWVRANRVALDCADHLARARSTMQRTIRSRRPVSVRRAGIDPARDFGPSPKVVRLRPDDNVVPRYDGRWPDTGGDPRSR